jgi:hypothetical protein
MDTAAHLPTWLAPPPSMPTLSSSELAALRRENEVALYPALFERALQHIAEGNPLTSAIENYPLPITATRFMAWIHRDEERRTRYYEAQEIGAEVVANQMIDIADAEDTVEDVQRSTLRINTRKWLLGVWNRKRFGEIKQVEQNVTIDIGEAMAAAQARVDAARTVEVVAREVR